MEVRQSITVRQSLCYPSESDFGPTAHAPRMRAPAQARSRPTRFETHYQRQPECYLTIRLQSRQATSATSLDRHGSTNAFHPFVGHSAGWMPPDPIADLIRGPSWGVFNAFLSIGNPSTAVTHRGSRADPNLGTSRR